jgi:hypothetical protein
VKRHLAYLRYVVKHKLYVGLACLRYGLWWRAIKHDWQKFLPREWFPYAQSFYNEDGSRRDWKTRDSVETNQFDDAWNHHQKSCDHHWQHFLLVTDSDEPRHRPLMMPVICIREMVADWVGAGRAITGKIEVCDWYAKNKDKILLHPSNRLIVEDLLKDWETGEYRNESTRERIRVLGY